MLTRDSLEKKSLAELKRLVALYGCKPARTSCPTREQCIDAIMRFPFEAIAEMRDNVGLRVPNRVEIIEVLTHAQFMIGAPTEAQASLIRASLQRHYLDDEIDRHFQDKLLHLWLTRNYVDMAIKMV